MFASISYMYYEVPHPLYFSLAPPLAHQEIREFVALCKAINAVQLDRKGKTT
jgi:hypothetical protein